MDRQLDREIQALRRGSVRDQLSLLWRKGTGNRFEMFSYWEAGPWSSPYVIAALQKRRFRSTLRAVAEINYGARNKDMTFLTHQVLEGAPPEVLEVDAREARVRLRSDGASRRPELCDWLVSIGARRDELDIPRLKQFADHGDEVVRYTVLGMLSWNPEIGNDQLLAMFGEDEDPRVKELAHLFGHGRVLRATRGR
jgi:hypothetical protein